MVIRLVIGAVVLLLAGVAWFLLMPQKPHSPVSRATVALPEPVAGQAAAANDSTTKAAGRQVRVVYPDPAAIGQTTASSTPAADVTKVAKPVGTSTETQGPGAPPSATVTPASAASNDRGPTLPASGQPLPDMPPTESKQTININSASVEELNHLAGAGRIGLAITSHRPYRSIEDLVTKRVVRKSVFEQIRGQLAAE